MKVIGITGGVGSGKSEVLTYLEKEHGASVIKTDDVARELQKKGTDCHAEIVKHFGEKILRENGELDRKALAHIVFRNKEALQLLNSLVHPAVKEEVKERIRKEKELGTSLLFIESAILFEDHYDLICDEIWYVFAGEETRTNRLRNSRGYSDERIKGLFKSQMSHDEMFERADRAIDNDGCFEESCRQIDEMIADMDL